MVDDHRCADRPNELLDLDNPIALDVDGNVPTERLHQSDHGPNLVEVRLAAKMTQVAETYSAHSRRIERTQHVLTRIRLNQGDTAVASGPDLERIEDRSVIHTVAFALHDHGPLQAKVIMQAAQLRFGRLVRRERPVRGEWEAVEGAVDVAVRVACPVGK